MARTGIQAFLDLLAEFGVEYLFGNPGSTELPLNDALVADRRMQYILGLQEVPVMAIADGYSMASRSLGVVNLHISCGLGNGMGMLYNAFREGTPLLVTAGQQDRRLQFEEPILGGDMVSVARPWTKWAAEVTRVEDLPVAVRRAVQTALTPPTGPVFLSMPVDVQMEWSESLDMSPIQLPNPAIRPSREALDEAVEVLRQAKNPGILAGSRISELQAMDALVVLAERLGAVVMTESGTTHGRLAFPSDHPLNGQGLPLWSPEVRERLADFDVLLVTGMDLFRQYIYHEPARAIPEHIRLVHLDEDPWQLGKNYPVAVGLWGHTREGLEEISDLLDERMTAEQVERARQRAQQHGRHHQAEREELRQKIDSQADLRPMTPLCLMDAVARVIPANVAVVEEAVTTTNTTLERLGKLTKHSSYFGHRGWALGWGLGCAIGAQLAWPDRPVLGLLGEGAAMYGFQGLWSAAHHKIPVRFVICNNAQYQILKVCANEFDLPQAREGKFEGMDLGEPEIDFVALAQSLGVQAHRTSEPDEVSDWLKDSFQAEGPMLLDVPIARGSPSRLNYG
ncbi:MAG TPA: hypothetical protein EYN70_08790 [Planctomycetaceae bacterium]|nr:hypothetical protein [Planctomycetaceae bacterium]